MKKRTKCYGIALLATMILATAVLNGCGCDNNKATPDSAVATVDEATENTNETNTTATYADGTTIAADKTNTEKATSDNKAATTATTATAANDQNNKDDKKTTNNNTNNASDKNNNNSGNSTDTNNNGNSGNSNSGKTWHEAVYEDIYHPAETKQVKVVDQAAYSYEEPVYDYVYHAICNTCGADITNNRYEHVSIHLAAHEGGSWSDVPKYEQTGTKTVNVPEQSHYETQIVKEAWTEHKLIREAGYY